MLAHTETHTTQHRCIQSHKESRRAEKEKKKRKIPPAFSRVCFWPLRPVWKHEWEFCKSMGTTDLVSSKSTADWHVFHVISCIVERWERLSSSDWLVKACFAVVHACVKGGSICLTINDAPTSSHSSVRHWIMSNITPPPTTATITLTQIKGFLSPPLLSKIIGFMTVDFRKVPHQLWWLLSTPAGLQKRTLDVCTPVCAAMHCGVRVISWRGKKVLLFCA